MIKSNLEYYAVKAGFQNHTELANLMKVHRCTIYYWVKGHRVPSLESALRLSKLLKQPVDEIFRLGD